jgi:predicted nucleic acid-binding protein
MWMVWSRFQLERAAASGPLIINDIIYAEVSVRYATIEAVESLISELKLEILPIPRAALFLAAKAFGQYRARAGTRTSLMPNLFIGAHAQVLHCNLLTRDVARYRTCFPSLRLIVPD